MSISEKEVEHVALLARLGLSSEQKKRFATELSRILELVSELQEADTADVPETSQVTGLRNVVRPDEVRPSLSRETFLKNAPASQADQLKVKGIFS
jgi:aspartyl-tRNA(Asn)/glutamyl-tRNA(Gln) amidotransferase subunit C